MKKLSEESGFTLIETLVAMTVFTIGILSLYAMQVSAIQGNSSASRMTTAATAGADQLETIFAMDYDALVDTDNDSVAGLYHYEETVAEVADGKATTSDGSTIYWNVANDSPMPATKRVVVNVVRTDLGYRKNVEYEYIKAQVVQR